MSTARESTGLTTRDEQSSELAVSAQQAMAEKEIEGAIIVANRFPRNEDEAYGRVMRSCERFTFAAMTCYSYPRGDVKIEGASVNLAREAARCWGNIRYGADIVHDDERTRTVRGWAWDVQTNTRESQDATFKKLVYRKKGGWVKPDERDLRELTNKHAAIAVRNCLLHLVPPDLIEDAIRAAKKTLESDAAKDPDEARKRLIRAFQGVGVSVADLEVYLDHPLSQITPAEITELRGVYKSILDGNSVWKEHVADKVPPAERAESGNTALRERLARQKAEQQGETASPTKTGTSVPCEERDDGPGQQEPDQQGESALAQIEADLANATGIQVVKNIVRRIQESDLPNAIKTKAEVMGMARQDAINASRAAKAKQRGKQGPPGSLPGMEDAHAPERV